MAQMNKLQFFVFTAAFSLCTVPVLAHTTRATMDAAGGSATFTGLANVTCSNDGSGAPALLTARVRDNSPAVPGLLINLQILKDGSALSISDPVSGDANYSESIAVPGGAGVYTMMVNKTAAGARNFDIEWHCMTADGQHAGTDIIVRQFN
jgi:hypothetical protein